MKSPAVIVGLILCVLVAFCITDCSCGSSQPFDAVVIGHDHRPAWTEYYTDTDSKGHTHLHSTYHPEQWNLSCDATDRNFSVSVDSGTFYRMKDGEQCVVFARIGKWTGWSYFESVTVRPKLER